MVWPAQFAVFLSAQDRSIHRQNREVIFLHPLRGWRRAGSYPGFCFAPAWATILRRFAAKRLDPHLKGSKSTVLALNREALACGSRLPLSPWNTSDITYIRLAWFLAVTAFASGGHPFGSPNAYTGACHDGLVSTNLQWISPFPGKAGKLYENQAALDSTARSCGDSGRAAGNLRPTVPASIPFHLPKSTGPTTLTAWSSTTANGTCSTSTTPSVIFGDT